MCLCKSLGSYESINRACNIFKIEFLSLMFMGTKPFNSDDFDKPDKTNLSSPFCNKFKDKQNIKTFI